MVVFVDCEDVFRGIERGPFHQSRHQIGLVGSVGKFRELFAIVWLLLLWLCHFRIAVFFSDDTFFVVVVVVVVVDTGCGKLSMEESLSRDAVADGYPLVITKKPRKQRLESAR
jgi:hypothetical protein